MRAAALRTVINKLLLCLQSLVLHCFINTRAKTTCSVEPSDSINKSYDSAEVQI